MTVDTIKTIIVDDHPVVREGLRLIFEVIDDIEIVGDATSGRECLELLEEMCPDVILMDIRLQGINGIETTRIVTSKCPHTKVIMLTIYEDDDLVGEAIRSGAKAYVLKSVARDELVKIVRDVVDDKVYLDPSVAPKVFDYIQHGKMEAAGADRPQLTQRELEILNSLASGMSDRGISDELCISESTVRSHIRNIYGKLGVSSRSMASAKALDMGIIHRPFRNRP